MPDTDGQTQSLVVSYLRWGPHKPQPRRGAHAGMATGKLDQVVYEFICGDSAKFYYNICNKEFVRVYTPY